MKPLLKAGLSITVIARKTGVTPPTVCYHARRLGYDVVEGRPARRRTEVVAQPPRP